MIPATLASSGRRLSSRPADPGLGALPDQRLMTEAQTSSCVADGKLSPCNILTFISCRQEKSHWERAGAADFYTWVTPPPPQAGDPQTIHRYHLGRQWTGCLLPPSLTFLEACRLAEAAVSVVAVSSVPPLSLGPHPCTPIPFTLKTYLSLLCDWYLCDVALAVQLFLQVSARLVSTVELFSLETQPTLPETPTWVI